MHTMHLLPSVAIRPNLELKTQPKELLGSLLLVIALPDNREYIDRQLIGTAHKPCFGLVTTHNFAVVPQPGAKDQFYGTVYYITLNLKCAAQKVSKHL
jgi:hypothetical protein